MAEIPIPPPKYGWALSAKDKALLKEFRISPD